jgi:Ras-related protein Rab-7A
MKKPKKLFKVVVLGDSGVGKTSLINRYVYQKFSMRYMATIGSDFHAKELTVDDRSICMQIWDTAGQERFQSLSSAYYRGSDAALLTFDVTAEDSFNNLQTWMNEFLIQAQPRDVDKFPIVLMGNKVDQGPQKRQVTAKRAQEWCAKNGGIPYFETSAMDDYNVEQAFLKVAQLVIQVDTDDANGNTFRPTAVGTLKLDDKSVTTSKCCG